MTEGIKVRWILGLQFLSDFEEGKRVGWPSMIGEVQCQFAVSPGVVRTDVDQFADDRFGRRRFAFANDLAAKPVDQELIDRIVIRKASLSCRTQATAAARPSRSATARRQLR